MSKKGFRKMYITICGRFCPDAGAVAGCVGRIRAKHTAICTIQKQAGNIAIKRADSSV
ncbi:DUF6783 domain-containing protein [Ruminococcus sp. AM42-11]|uniref:DUF6783 domain-containing protein n=1 Tax=Ruminococcus sp. AM42-11 TaxID=2292372 RepID=UPI00325B4B18